MSAILKPIAFLCIIAAAYLAKRAGLFKPRDYRIMQVVVFDCTLPASILVSFATNPNSASLLWVTLFGFLAAFIPVPFVFLASRKRPVADRAFLMLNSSGYNIGNFCFPLLQAFYGGGAIVTGAMFDIGNAIMTTAGSNVMTTSLLHIDPNKPLTEQNAGDAPTLPYRKPATKQESRALLRARLRTIALGFLKSGPFDMYMIMTLVVLFTTGIVGSSVAMAKDWADTARILLFPGTGWPQQTGVMEVKQLAAMNSSFVELGEEGCVVWSRTGTRLNSIQSGYARPALAVGKNRFVLYNRSGNELRVESRTQNLYTKTMESSITLCAMADNGTLAVVTEDPGSAARIRVYSSAMEQLLSWSLTIADGTPLRLAFSPDGRRLAVAAVTVNGGQMVTNFYVVTLAQGDPMLVGSGSGAAQWLSWTGSQSILAVCDSRAVLYNASGGERAAYDFTGQTLRDISVDASGNTALLLASGQLCQAVMLGRDLGVENTTQVQASNRIVRAGDTFYLLTDTGVECLSTDGTSQWTQSLSARPQGLLADRRQLLVFCGNTVQVLTPPAAENNAQSNT